MMIEAETLEALQRATQAIVTFIESNGVTNDYGLTALHWLEHFINLRRDAWTLEQKDNITANIGAFFGECLGRAYQGEWDTTQFGEAIVFDKGKHMIFPISKVAKFIENGEEDSFAYFFTVFPQIRQHYRDNGTIKSNTASDDA